MSIAGQMPNPVVPRALPGPGAVPSYLVLLILGRILEIVGVLDIAGVVFVWLAADPRSGSVSALGTLTLVSAAVGGVLLVALTQLMFCVRDMARNSFLLRYGQ